MTLLGMFTHPPYVYLESQQKTTCLPHPGLHKCSPALWNMLDVQLINTATTFTAKKTQSNQLSKKLKQATMWLCSEHTMCSRESRKYCMYLYAVKILFFINPYNLSFGHCHQTYNIIWEQMRISSPYVYQFHVWEKTKKYTKFPGSTSSKVDFGLTSRLSLPI
jgi:hypothetical protein